MFNFKISIIGISIVLCAESLFSSTPPSSLSAIEQNMFNKTDQFKDEIYDASKQIWDFKELGGKEIKSSALLVDIFKRHGFTVQKGLIGVDPTNSNKIDLPTAFIAIFNGKSSGPTIGVMVEYDALPNGHACGHNLISASGLASAFAIQEALKSTPGRLMVFGTPAEETDGNKIHMLAAGLMKSVDVMFETHGGAYWTSELNVKGIMWARYNKDALQFIGKASHASSAPWKGRSALDAAMLTGIGIEFLREHMIETDRLHYAILSGGKAANVVPDYAKMDLYVRANTTPELMALAKRVEKVIAGAAMMTETEAKYEWDAPFLNAIPARELWKFVAQNAPGVGLNQNIFKVNISAGGSSDNGNVGYEIPTSNITFPITDLPEDKAPAGHSDGFRDAACTDYAINNSILAGKLIALSAYRILTDSEELAKIKNDFSKNKEQ